MSLLKDERRLIAEVDVWEKESSMGDAVNGKKRPRFASATQLAVDGRAKSKSTYSLDAMRLGSDRRHLRRLAACNENVLQILATTGLVSL